MRKGIVALILLVAILTAGANDQTLFSELDARLSPLPAAVTDNGATIVGNFNGGGGFYWTPTTGAIFTGGLFASDVSADGWRQVLPVGRARLSRASQVQAHDAQ